MSRPKNCLMDHKGFCIGVFVLVILLCLLLSASGCVSQQNRQRQAALEREEEMDLITSASPWGGFYR